MYLVTTTDRVFPATSPFDFVLVRTADSAGWGQLIIAE
jgi:hypothetical protein